MGRNGKTNPSYSVATVQLADHRIIKLLTILMCIYTGLVNIKNPSKSVQWGSVVVLLLFNIVNGSSWIWLGVSEPHSTK